MNNTLKKGIAGVALASAIGGGAVVIDNSTVTDTELLRSMNEAIIEGKIPQIDLEKVSPYRVVSAYAQIATENGVDLTPTADQIDLYDKIREAKENKGEVVSPRTNDVLRVR